MFNRYVAVEDDIEQTTRSCAEELEPIIQEREEAEGCILSTGTKNVHVSIDSTNEFFQHVMVVQCFANAIVQLFSSNKLYDR